MEKKKKGGIREGSGRPPKLHVRYNLRLSLEAAQALEKVSGRLGISKTEVIEKSLMAFEKRCTESKDSV